MHHTGNPYMKRALIIVLPLLIVISTVFLAFGVIHARMQRNRLLDEVKRKAKAVAESTELFASYALKNKDLKSAYKIVDRFQKRERLQGCVLYDTEGKIIAITERYNDWKDKERPYISELIVDHETRGEIEKFGQDKVYSYVLPVQDDDANFLGLLEIIYDISYIKKGLHEFYNRIYLTLALLILLIISLFSMLHKQFFVKPVVRLTKWFHEFQRGNINDAFSQSEHGELGNLASEVEQLALSLRIAKKNISKEAFERLQSQEVWDESKLKDHIRAKLGTNELVMVSNREPYMHVIDDGSNSVKCIRPASGVVTAIDSVMSSCGGVWVAHGAGNADKKMVNSKDKLAVPENDNKYILKRVWLSKEEEDGYYYGFSNEGLWPLCHITYTRPLFRETDWQMYQKANQKFAESVLEDLPANNPLVFVQDYHFTLLPAYIKEKRPDAKIVLFWHIPWPNPEVFSICPYQKEILEGMLACDLIGFHVQYHCNNFLDTVNRLLECRIDTEKFSIVRGGKETLIKPFPISVDEQFGSKTDCGEMKRKIREDLNLHDKIIGIGVERIDYTKGILERILAIDRFFEKYPEYRKKMVFIQLAAPSRTHIKKYHDLGGEIDELIEKKNWKYMDGNWKPIIFLKKHLSPEEIIPYYRLGDFCIVSSLHDGMNLVAKEYVSQKQDSNGVLILSKFTGASRELDEAVIINPYDIEQFAESIRYAIEMKEEEKKHRMERMKQTIRQNNIYRWAGNIITELTLLKRNYNPLHEKRT